LLFINVSTKAIAVVLISAVSALNTSVKTGSDCIILHSYTFLRLSRKTLFSSLVLKVLLVLPLYTTISLPGTNSNQPVIVYQLFLYESGIFE
jgi:hypothetical protein